MSDRRVPLSRILSGNVFFFFSALCAALICASCAGMTAQQPPDGANTVAERVAPDSRVLAPDEIDVSAAVVLVSPHDVPRVERTAAEVLVEEVERRTGIRWETAQDAAAVANRPVVIRLRSTGSQDESESLGLLPEGFQISVSRDDAQTVVDITGADGRGVLFGVGYFLRKTHWSTGQVTIDPAIAIATSPQYAIRGHQLGYRATNNTVDAWTPEQFELYIRELAFFGSNAVENIPGQGRPDDHMVMSRQEMNRVLSDICDKYDVDYWLWTPATFDLTDPELRAAALRENEELYRDTPRLDGIFIPGADPGDNHPSLVLPFAEELAAILHTYHPNAGMWISAQGYVGEKGDYFFGYIRENRPEWLAGVVAGPQAYRPVHIRKLLPDEYPIRQYPDITHTVRCQYPVPWWDLAWELTLGREPSNPRPIDYTEVIRLQTPATVGFLAYSDGVHDNVNKVLWSALAWDLDQDPRDVLVDYARVYFGPEVAEQAADGIRAFELNWQGPVLDNSGIVATLLLWQQLERNHPELGENWRWNMALLRAYYDAYVYYRLRHEQAIEADALDALAAAPQVGADAAMEEAARILARADTDLTHPELRQRVVDICQTLFEQIGFQTSVEKYGASGAERGAVLDFLDIPLNDRLWLEREFASIAGLPSEEAKLERLETVRTWSDPGPGGRYDNIGQAGMMPHIVRSVGYAAHPANVRGLVPHFRGDRDWKLAWKVNMHWPVANLEYVNLDPEAEYQLKVTGVGELIPLADDVELDAEINSTEIGELRLFPVPHELTADGTLTITWCDPDDRHLNWRQWSRVHEVWLIRK